jgi:hypothetical protein
LKNQLVITVVVALLAASSFAQETFTRADQLKLAANYMYITGKADRLSGEALSAVEIADLDQPLKCGTPIRAAYVLNYDKLDKSLVQRYALFLRERPTGHDRAYDSPAGLFKIHYRSSGDSAVYQSWVDGDGDGHPDFVESVADIFDSVYFHIIDTLGYPVPPSDGGYGGGGDSLYDIYLSNFGGTLFGQTAPDSIPLGFSGPDTMRATSFIEIDNDYQESSFAVHNDYNARPLDAVRVTAAHEFFHAVHFGIDFAEMEEPYGDARPYWFEMSATWMEEEIYDDINDYYYPIQFFYNDPNTSIQRFLGPSDFHPYGSVVFPLFLSEVYGRDIVRDIWLQCGALGRGPSFLRATDFAIDLVSGGSDSYLAAFREFALWNYFTGSRAAVAPAGVGYSEREFFPEFPESRFSVIDEYTNPVVVNSNSNPLIPEPNAAAIMRLDHTRAIVEDSLKVFLGLGDGLDSALLPGWGVNYVYQSDSLSHQYSVERDSFPDDSSSTMRKAVGNPNQYRSLAIIVAPASVQYLAYTWIDYSSQYGYFILGTLDSTRIDTLIAVDSSAINIAQAILTPYPNPALVGQMGGENLRFRFQIETDAQSVPTYWSPYLVVDIYTEAGEFIQTADTVANPFENPDPYVRTVEFEVGWDMRNQAGAEVASGVYIALLRMFAEETGSELIGEAKAKVLIVR